MVYQSKQQSKWSHIDTVRPRYDRSNLCLVCHWLSAGLRHPVYSVDVMDVMAAACCKAVVAYSE